MQDTAKFLGGLAAGMLLASAVICAAEAPPGSPDAIQRPRIGLALSGGGAKGGAHVGVLQVLEELRVPVDCIAGTSIGAIVGGGYAMGMSAAELKEFLLGIDWQAVMDRAEMREEIPIERKRAGSHFAAQVEFGAQDGHVMLPEAIVPTTGVEYLLRGFTARAHDVTDFDQLPIPFRAVATDMVTGEMVVISDGDLATAMRASMAIPGLFAPVVTGQRVLADGGMVRNVPVDVVRALCADVVIAVNLIEGVVPPERLRTAAQLAMRGMSLTADGNSVAQLATLGGHDVRIDVYTGRIAAADVDRTPSTVPIGIAAARAASPRLRELALSPETYAAWREQRLLPAPREARVAEVRYEGLEMVNPAYLAAHARVRPGDPVSSERLRAEALRIAALGEFESVEYRLEGDPESPTLVWLPKERTQGPHRLSADIGVYAITGEKPGFIAYLGYTRSWLNDRGGEWRNQFQVGQENFAGTSFYQPLDEGQVFFVEPLIAYVASWENLYEEGDRIAAYRFVDWLGRLDFGMNLSADAQARIGYTYMRRHFDRNTGEQVLPRGNVRDGTLAISASYDNRDSAFIPTRGLGATVEVLLSEDWFGADRDWRRADMGLKYAIPLDRNVFWFALSSGTEFDSDLPFDRAFAIGGPSSFPGLQFGELRTPRYWTASTAYLREIRLLAPMIGHSVYAGAELQAGWFSDEYGLFDDEHIYGISAFLAGRTILGPMSLGAAATTDDTLSLWLTFGRRISPRSMMDRGVLR